MKLGQHSSVILSQHNSLVIVMNAALGDGKSGGAPTVHDPSVRNIGEGHANIESAVAAINAMMTI